MKNTNKKGFTIVELVIVIAVIAILAAVLIPTFSNVINSAHKSADSQLVRNLNTAVSTELAASGKTKASTAYEALSYAKNNGYDVSVIVATSDNEIAWSVDTGTFVLIDVENETAVYPTTNGSETLKVAGNEVNYFLICSEMPTEGNATKYSIYAGEGWTEATVSVNGVGFDAGDSTVVTTVNYTNISSEAKDVVIRTNGGTLSINDTNPDSHQYHYGYAASATVKTGTSCYECHAIVESMTVTAGKAIAGEGAYVGLVAASSGVTLEEKDDGIFVIPETAVASKIDATVASQIDYTISENTITASADRATKAAAATEEVNNKLIEQAKENNSAAVVRIGTKGYANVNDALSAAQDGDTVILLGNDSDDSAKVSGNKAITLDLNGNTYTLTGAALSIQSGASLTIKDSGTNGEITSSVSYSSAIGSSFPGKVNPTIKIEGNESTLIVESGTISSDNNFAIGAYGDNGNTTPNIKINGGLIQSSRRQTIYITSLHGNIEVNGGTITGGSYDALTIKTTSGGVTPEINLKITGGTISKIKTDGSTNCDISGGTISDGSLAMHSNTTGFITGGTFGFNPSSYVANGYNVYTNGTDYKVATTAPDGYTLVE